MANTWPKTGDGTLATGYVGTGVTTICWGTDGLLQSPKPASGFYVVTRFTQRPKVENIKLTNAVGPTATRILLVQGYTWEITVRDDDGMTPPDVGDSVTITDAAGIVPASVGGAAQGNVFTATIVENGYETAPKQPGERILTVETLTLIEGYVKGAAV